MATSARAAIFVEPRKVEVRTIHLPDPADDDVLVRTSWSAISTGTELWCLTGHFWERKFPAVPGYQKAGVVERVGRNVKAYRPGDRVFLRMTKAAPDVQLQWGGHTSHSVVAADDVSMLKLPDKLLEREASMLSVAAVGYRGAAEVMPIAPDETVVVLGVGLIGQFSSQVARAKGARVAAVDVVDSRLELAGRLAGARTINPAREDVAAVLKQMCPDGVDAVIDTTANVELVNKSFNWLRHAGRYCFQAFYPDRTPLDMLVPHVKELVMYNPIDSSPEGYRRCAHDAAEGSLHLAELISHEFPAERAAEAYQMLLDRREEAMCVVLNWQEGGRA